jgi:hypothetical protein
MNQRDFIAKLVSSYPDDGRPGAFMGEAAGKEFLQEVVKYLKHKNWNEDDLHNAYDVIVTNFRRFPSISELHAVFINAHSRNSVKDGTARASEYFTLNGHDYCRYLDINSSGDVIRKEIPEGAENYHLCLPEHMRHERFMTADEAFKEGAISNEFYAALKAARVSRIVEDNNRWKKISQEISTPEPVPFEDKYESLSGGVSPEDFIDDSMAANPEDFEEPKKQFWYEDL